VKGVKRAVGEKTDLGINPTGAKIMVPGIGELFI